MDDSFELVLGDWWTSRGQLQAIRRKVFIIEQKIPEADEFDAADENSSHVLVLSEKRDAVGTGRIEPTGKIARLAVVAEYRDRGVGTAILERLIEEARKRGYDRVFLHAQTQALDFYKKFGFVSDGRVFMEAGIPHVLASLDL
jgi:predicted GNAT family N-acyltransferase